MTRFAVFDIDGTLIRWQLYHVMADKLAKNGLLGPSAKDQLKTARMKWKRREHSKAFHDYEAKLIEIYEAAVPTIETADFDNLINDIIEEYKDQTYTYTKELAKTLKDKGYVLLAISGSHHELVSKIAEYYGFDDAVGTKYERLGEAFTGNKFVGSHDKKSTLQKLVAKHKLTWKDSYAVGDSLSDASMLELAENPIAFNPNQELYEIATKNNWKIVIERKNVIYELENDHGKYLLA